MAVESRLERWQRTGALQVVVFLVVLGTSVYFWANYPAAERPVVLNEVLLASVTWMAAKFVMNKNGNGKNGKNGDKPKEPEPEPENGGRHRAP